MSISGFSSSNQQILLSEARSAKETLPARKLPSSQIGAFDKLRQPSLPYAKADNASGKLFAEVSVNGKVVAKIWESGLAKLPSHHANLASKLVDSGSEMQTARDRAEQIAKALGGDIKYSGEPHSYSFSESLAKLLSS